MRQIGQVHGLANAAIVRPVVKGLFEVRHQAEIPGVLFQAFQAARMGEPGPVAVLIPYPLLIEVWDYDLPVPPPCPVPFDEAAYGRVLTHLMDRRQRVGIYAGLGCVDDGGCPGGRRRAASGAGGHIGQRQGLHSRRPSAGGRLGLRQTGDACRRGGVQGRRSGARRRRPLQRGLDGLSMPFRDTTC